MVERGLNGRDSPCLYYDAVPMSIRATMRFGWRLDHPAERDMSISVLYGWYVKARDTGKLEPSNIQPHEYWVR